MEADGGLPGAGAALDDERRVGAARDEAVLVRLDRGDDVAHASVAHAIELLQEEVVDGRGSIRERPVERLVADAREPPPLRPEPAAQSHAVGLGRGRRVERARRRRLPVDDDDALVVVYPAAAHVERAFGGIDVDPAEAEAALGVLEADETPRRPGLDRLGRDLRRAGRGGPEEDLPHLVEALVGVVEVRLLGREIRVRHASRTRRSPTRGARVRDGGRSACAARGGLGSPWRPDRPGWRRATPRPHASGASRSDPSRRWTSR